jgi:hypothetical protein
MSTPDTPKPRLDPYWEQQFEAMSMALLGLADRVEELEERRSPFSPRAKESSDLELRVAELESQLKALQHAFAYLREHRSDLWHE